MNMVTRDEIVDLVRDGKRYREKRSAWERLWIFLFVAVFVKAPLDGWLLMMAVGVIHHEWWPAVPTIGYWWAVLVAELLRRAIAASTPSGSKP